MEELSKEKWGAERKMKRTRDWGSGVGTSIKTDVLVKRTNVTKVTENTENLLHIYSEYWMQGVRWEMPLFK